MNGVATETPLWMSGIFADHMVVQRDQPIRLWGRSLPGRTVTAVFAGRQERAEVDAAGTWRLQLPALPASEQARELRVSDGVSTLHFQDVLVGEVWLCSGQSNMQWPVRESADGDLIAACARDQRIRLLGVDRVPASTPRSDLHASWQVCSPDAVQGFSAVGYLFGQLLRDALQVPVGLIDASWGGTPAIAWTRERVYAEHPPLVERAQRWAAQPAEIREQKAQDAPAALANGMLAPLAGFRLAGVIWYQGETDAWWQPDHYHERLGLMIRDWRDWWQQPDMPFGIVQLAGFFPHQEAPVDAPWAHLRDSQLRLSQRMPGVGLAVIHDSGEANDIHPRDKRTPAERLARWALAEVYGLLERAGGPLLETVTVEGPRLVLHFDTSGIGLLPFQGEPLRGFTIAGEDRVFHVAQAELVPPDDVVVSSPEVPQPQAVRYGWQNNPRGSNLYDNHRQPASPFRSDDWPMTEKE